MSKKFYVSTPIYYPNAKLHIGHAYTTTLADYINRYKKFRGYETYFVTGSDEHGQKLETEAKKNNEDPLTFVTRITQTFINLWKDLGIDYDHFIRTTDKEHELYVQNNFSKLFKKDFIYKSYYEGWYCQSDEAFFTEIQLSGEHRCPACNKDVEWIKEESYFLKIAEFKDFIQDKLENTSLLIPSYRVIELINNFVNDLQDLSITRTSFDWGIKINEDQKHVVYVWLDALQNYLSTLTYKNSPWTVDEVWAKDSDVEILQLVGKEITRFHAIYWPIILEMLGYREPKILAHGWLVSDDGEKMSKSIGNVVDPLELIKLFGRDPLRFYLVNNIVTGDDGRFSLNLLKESINGILVNKYSNLVFRTNIMIQKYFKGIVPKKGKATKLEIDLKKQLDGFKNEYFNLMDHYEFSKATKLLINYVEELNKYIDLSTPWKKVGDEYLETILNFLTTEIFNVTSLLGLILIDSADCVYNWLSFTGIPTEKDWDHDFSGTKLKYIGYLFTRLI